jgi:hypothetical protein
MFSYFRLLTHCSSLANVLGMSDVAVSTERRITPRWNKLTSSWNTEKSISSQVLCGWTEIDWCCIYIHIGDTMMAMGSLWILMCETLLTAFNFRVERCCRYRDRSVSYWIYEENSNGIPEKMCNEAYYNVCLARDIIGKFIRGALDGLDLHNFYTLKKYMQNLVEKLRSKRLGSYQWLLIGFHLFFD